MIDNILPDFYRIEVTLPKSLFKVLNAYIIKGNKPNHRSSWQLPEKPRKN